MANKLRIITVLLVIVGLVVPASVASQPAQAAAPITFSILHTNDFHGQLEASGSNPGSPSVAYVVNAQRTLLGAQNVLLVDAGDEMQGSLLSNLQQGKPTIAVYNAMGYNAATFGNHEFDWGQQALIDRTGEAAYPYVSANIVVNDTGNCATAGWTPPAFAQPYDIQTLNTSTGTLNVAFIGVTTTETPVITIASATSGLCFKDPADSIIHYYDTLKGSADVIVVLSHLGYTDGGYGYGIPVYGDQTLATKLIIAGKPVPLIIGGHSHTNLSAATVVGGQTSVVQAYYNGRKVGRADLSFDPATKNVTVAWQSLAVPLPGVAPTAPPGPSEDAAIKTLVQTYSNDPAYQALINQPVGYAQVDLLRNYNGDSMMGDFVDDAVYNALNTDADLANDVDMFFNNPGGIRTDWCDKENPPGSGTYIWSSLAADCNSGVWAHDPMLLNYGQMFTILPFGNATVVGTMTGAQIVELLNQAATLGKGAIQPAGMEYKFYRYSDALPGPQPYAWGGFDGCVVNKSTGVCEPLDLQKTYKVGTNEFLAPAGGDNFLAFKYMTNVTYWGDMLNAVNAWVSANFTFANPYKGPNGDGTLDGRITRDGNDVSGSIIPITILHHNDSHGRLQKTSSVGYTQLATLIKQEKAHNPNRSLLLTAGDNIQGDSMMYYFKSAPLGYTADGTPLLPPLTTHPLIAAFNAMGYDAMTLGNHEFNFGSQIFTSVLGQANFPMLQANLADDGQYGIDQIPVKPYIEKVLDGIKIAILGIGNHRVPNYELPSNIPGLTFSDPLATAQQYANLLRPNNDVVVALTHIGFTEDPKSVEVDANVDTNMAKTVTGLDTIIGGHSHTNPSTGFGSFKYLPTIVADPNDTPVLITQAYRYNTYLGEVVIGVRPNGAGGYDVVTRAGQYISVATATAEDAQVKAIIDPYVTALAAYNNKVIGQTTEPIDTTNAYIGESNAANLQADASVWELASHGITDVDFHLSGAMTQSNPKIIAAGATPATPVQLKVSDMFTLMPYENSLVVLSMNGPQLKAVLERAYRNYFYYKYVPGYGGYSYYTTCMLDTNFGGKITYNDLYPAVYDPAKNYVVSLEFDGHEVDFSDATTYYNVSTVNYLAAGSCNFNNGGVSLWPLNQIVHDTQYYVRDAVINYTTAMGTIGPKVEGRLNFIYDVDAPLITINAPVAASYLHTASLTLDFNAVDVGPAGLLKVWADLDGTPVMSGDVIDLLMLPLGDHTLTVNAVDKATNASTASVTFSLIANSKTLKDAVTRFYNEGKIDNAGLYNSLMKKLDAYEKALAKGNLTAANNQLNAFINEVAAQSGKHIAPDAAAILIADAQWVIAHPNAKATTLTPFVTTAIKVFLPAIHR